MPETPFKRELKRELWLSRWRSYKDNYDTSQLGAEPPVKPPVWKECGAEFKQRLKELVGTLIQPLLQHLEPLRPYLRPVKRAILYYLIPDRYFRNKLLEYDQVAFLYDVLSNHASRDLLVKISAYHILGYRKVKLPRNNPKYWQDIESINEYNTGAPPVKIKFMDASLPLHDFTSMGYKLKTYATAAGSACIFVQKQYEYHHGRVHCKAEPGDIVIDAGSCWGETTLYFAHEVGPNGQVISFEFVPSNLAVLYKNLANNPELARRVTLLEQPIWSYSGRRLYYVDWGPGSRITDDEKQYQYDGTCETITIDEVVSRERLPRVDFIKMDIETAEFPALLGAEHTIKTYRPKLAISIYHQFSDFVTIPRYLSELNLGYDFYLEHHTIYQNETVLFAVPREKVAVQPTPEGAHAITRK